MRPSPRAFSLLELILVMVIMGITTAVAAARLSPLRRSEGVVQAAHALEDQWLRGRRLAMEGGDLARVRLDLDAQTATVQVRTADGFVDPHDAELPDSDLRSGAEVQTITFSQDVPQDPSKAAVPGPFSSLSVSAGSQTQGKTTGLVDILFYPDGRCDPSGRMTFQKGESTTTVVCPPAGRPAYVEVLR